MRMLVTYRPKEGKGEELYSYVRKHLPALRQTGLLGEGPAEVFRATDKRSGKQYFVEMFSWRDEQAPNIAHQLPEVMAIWEPMTPLLEGLELAVLEPANGND
jgi:quinol monooxygenase YgiN